MIGGVSLMENRNSYRSSVHEDGYFFREAILYTATLTGFTSELIEKDYFCSILLSYLYGDDTPLIFRGGTCLSKIYGEFYRLSEDLDFTISVPFDAPRSLRRKKIEPLKKLLNDPFSRKPAVQEFSILCMSQREAYAEKIRAALTRKELAIRDFYDIDYA